MAAQEEIQQVALIGFFLLLFGVTLNISLIRGGRSRGLSAADIVRNWPWLVSAGLVIAGVALIVLARS